MAASDYPSIQELQDAKTDINNLETFANSTGTFTTRIGSVTVKTMRQYTVDFDGEISVAQAWASETDSAVISSPTALFSAKEYAQGSQAGTGGSAKKWASEDEDVLVDGIDYSAKHYAAKAQAALDDFEQIYLGEQSSDPSVDLNGDPLDGGEFYYNSVIGKIRIYDSGTASWSDAIDGATESSNNDWIGVNNFLAGGNFSLKDPTDTTKQVRFDVSGITTGTTRSYILPDASTGLVGESTDHTITGNQSFTADSSNAEPRVLQQFMADKINVKNYGATGTVAETDATTKIATARAAAELTGKTLYFPAGFYYTDPILSGAALKVHVDQGATVALKNSATLISGVTLAVFYFRHNDCALINDGVIDMNRAGQDKAAHKAAGGGNSRFFHAVFAIGASNASRISNFSLTGSGKIINACEMGFSARYVNGLTYAGVAIEDSSCGLEIIDCDDVTVDRSRMSDLDNDGWVVAPHAFDLFRVNGFHVTGWHCVDQQGYDTLASGDTLSQWFSGLTMIGCENGYFSDFLWSAKDDSAMVPSVGMSIIGNQRVTFSGGHVERGSNTGFEFGGNIDCHVEGVLIDGQWLTASLDPLSQIGVQASQTSFQDDEDLVIRGRAIRANTSCSFSNVRAIRNSSVNWAVSGNDGVDIIDCSGLAGRAGMEIQASNAASEAFPSSILQGNRKLRVIGGDWNYNDTDGIRKADGLDVEIRDVRAINNGQAKAYPGGRRLDGASVSSGAGIRCIASPLSLTSQRGSFLFPQYYDDQSTTGITCSANPSAATELWVSDPSKFHINQTIKLNGAGASGVDLFTRVNDIIDDKLVLDDAISTFPTVAGTGTISTSGTDVTGAGTAFLTEMQYRAFIKVGAEYRQVWRALTDTDADILSAFGSSLSGSAFDIVQISVDQVPSQDTGIEFHSSEESPLLVLAPSTLSATANSIVDNTASATPANIVKPYAGYREVQIGGVYDSNYTFRWLDQYRVARFNGGSPATYTIPANSSVAFPIGAKLEVLNISSSTLTIGSSSPVFMYDARLGAVTSSFTAGQYAFVTLTKFSTNLWLVESSEQKTLAIADGGTGATSANSAQDNLGLRFLTGSIADDAVYSFTPTGGTFTSAHVTFIPVATGSGPVVSAFLRGRSSPEFVTVASADPNTKLGTTGTTALTGTTGTDGRVNLAVDSNGTIYIENRLGFAASFAVRFEIGVA